MRRGFTLLELMAVAGIMAFLGLAAANGYNALRRGMAERGTVDTASALLRAAKERALVDRVPTAVYFWNRCVRAATDIDNAIVVGEAVAIRRFGRITHSNGNYLFDEFGDLDRSYDADSDDSAADLGSRKGFRLWHIRDDGNVSRMEYSIVADGVHDGTVVGVSFLPLADGDTTNISTNMDIRACAFYKLDGGTFSDWKVGAAYGMEFQRLTLPNGFLFGTKIPKTVGEIEEVDGVSFNPDASGGGSVADQTVQVSCCRTGADGNMTFDHKAGTASSKEQR